MHSRTEILLHLFNEAMQHVRHLEEQRSQFASVLVAIAGGIVAFGLTNDNLQEALYPGILLSGIGAFGILLSWKQNEQINYHRLIAIRHRALIVADPAIAQDQLEIMRKEVAIANGSRYCRISILPVGLFWSLLYALIMGFGIFVTVR